MGLLSLPNVPPPYTAKPTTATCLNLFQPEQAGRQADIQAGRQAVRQTNRQKHRQAGKQTYRQAGRQIDIQAGRQAERQTNRQRDRQTGRQADRQTGRQAGRQTQTGRQTDTQTELNRAALRKTHTASGFQRNVTLLPEPDVVDGVGGELAGGAGAVRVAVDVVAQVLLEGVDLTPGVQR